MSNTRFVFYSVAKKCCYLTRAGKSDRGMSLFAENQTVGGAVVVGGGVAVVAKLLLMVVVGGGGCVGGVVVACMLAGYVSSVSLCVYLCVCLSVSLCVSPSVSVHVCVVLCCVSGVVCGVVCVCVSACGILFCIQLRAPSRFCVALDLLHQVAHLSHAAGVSI